MYSEGLIQTDTITSCKWCNRTATRAINTFFYGMKVLRNITFDITVDKRILLRTCGTESESELCMSTE